MIFVNFCRDRGCGRGRGGGFRRGSGGGVGGRGGSIAVVFVVVVVIVVVVLEVVVVVAVVVPYHAMRVLPSTQPVATLRLALALCWLPLMWLAHVLCTLRT